MSLYFIIGGVFIALLGLFKLATSILNKDE